MKCDLLSIPSNVTMSLLTGRLFSNFSVAGIPDDSMQGASIVKDVGLLIGSSFLTSANSRDAAGKARRLVFV